MQPSIDDLLIRQISALISATADAASTSSEHAPFMEARLYETLAAHCAEKQRLAAAFARSGAAKTKRGLIYWEIGTGGSGIAGGHKGLKRRPLFASSRAAPGIGSMKIP